MPRLASESVPLLSLLDTQAWIVRPDHGHERLVTCQLADIKLAGSCSPHRHNRGDPQAVVGSLGNFQCLAQLGQALGDHVFPNLCIWNYMRTKRTFLNLFDESQRSPSSPGCEGRTTSLCVTAGKGIPMACL